MERNHRLTGCPSQLEISDFLDKSLGREKERALLYHIARCPNCLSLLELGYKAKEEYATQLTTKMLKRAQRLVPGQGKRSGLKQVWLILAAICFIFSFVIARFFSQFLVLAIIFSLKWILDTGSTRTLIMIYQAWRKKDSESARRIVRDLKKVD